MKATILALLVLGLAAATASGQYHHPTYLFGGYHDELNTNTMLTGVNLLDATGPARCPASGTAAPPRSMRTGRPGPP